MNASSSDIASGKIDDPDTVWRDLDLADARVRITEAIERSAMTVPPYETGTWPVCRPIVEWLTRRMPAGGVGYERPEWTERDQHELADRFFASRFGAPLDDADQRGLLESLIWFGTDYGPGDPLRWSPVAVEIILHDWIPRKLVADPPYLAKAPDLLRAFVRFCHAERGIRADLTDETIAAVDLYEPEYQRTIRSPRPQGPMALLAAIGAFDPDAEFAFDDGALMRELLREMAGGEDSVQALDDDPLPEDEFDWAGIPDDVRDKVGEVLQLSDACCDQLLDVEYRTACRRLLARAAGGDPGVFRRRASTATAAAAMCWIVGKDNDLFSPAGGRMLVKDLMAHFGLATYDQFILDSSAMEQTAPTPTVHVENDDFAAMDYSGSDDVTELVQAVDINLVGDRASTSGCEASDFAGFVAGNIALIQRGTCFFREKVDNAAAAGASAVIVFNQGNEDPNDDRFGVVFGTLDPPVAAIPAVGTTFAIGEALANTVGLQMRVAVDATIKTTTSFNVLADTLGGRSDRTVVVGAHLDSVLEGPGINDNGSGSAAILETALQMAELDIAPTNRVRFAFWGGEEDGLIGSEYYVSQLDARALKDHAVNLNFDMVGSENFVRFVYDGDGSAFGATGPNGSARVEQVFLDYFASQGLATEPTEFDGRSDYFAFINNGIPAGGLFTGAEGIKTADEAAIYGGTAGVAYDLCYHAACDDIDNLSDTALDQMSDAIAHSTLTFAMTTSAVNGTAKGGGGSTMDFALKGNLAIK